MEYFNDYRKLFLTVFGLFLVLTLLVAVFPAIHNQNINHPLPGSEPLTEEETAGKAIYISEGCVACHTQQVRNVDMDKMWGSRPSMPADYARNVRTNFWVNTATLMGTERTGPDLTNIGIRQPSDQWHLLHLYQPRAVVGQSVMPAYPWLFEEKKELKEGDVEIQVPDQYRRNSDTKIVATEDAMHLLAYLQSLKHVQLGEGEVAPDFLYKREEKTQSAGAGESGGEEVLNGSALYATHCQACHQENGEGLAGAFPSLINSAVVIDDDPELLIDIIMNGYDARGEYAVMPAVGANANLTPEEIAAIINHERSSWGNNGSNVPTDEVKKIMDYLKN